MRTFLFCISISVLLLQCFALGQDGVSAKFLKLEEDGFILLKTASPFLSGEEIKAVATMKISKIIVELKNDTINDTVIVKKEVEFFTKDCFVWAERSRKVSILITPMCWDYYGTYEARKEKLTEEDLKKFAKKANWSIRRVKINE